MCREEGGRKREFSREKKGKRRKRGNVKLSQTWLTRVSLSLSIITKSDGGGKRGDLEEKRKGENRAILPIRDLYHHNLSGLRRSHKEDEWVKKEKEKGAAEH